MRSVLVFILVATTLSMALGWGKTAPPPPTPPEPSMLQKILNFLTARFVESEEWLLPYLPIHISFLDTVLAIDTCAAYRKAQGKTKHPWLQVFVSCIICCFGGTTMTAFLLGQPPGWLGSLTSPTAYALGFWCIFCFPGDIPYKIWINSFPFRILLGLINCISGAHAVTNWGAEKALHAFHLGNVAAKDVAEHARSGYAGSGPFTLLCGTLSGCGGGVLGAWMHCNGASTSWSLEGTPPVLRKPTTTVKLAFASSVTYYMLRNPHHFLPWRMDVIPADEIKLLILAMWVAVLIAGDVFHVVDPMGWMMPVLSPITLIKGEIGGVPEPGFFDTAFGGSEKQKVKTK